MHPESLLNKIVFPIRIPTPFAVGDVFSYLLKDEKIVLVDCGQKTEEALQTVRAALQEQGLSLADIDEIWLTHGHPDHFGQAALLGDRSGARISGHGLERSNFAGNDDGELFENFFNRYGIPADSIQLMIGQLEWLQQFQIAVEPEWIDESSILDSGSMQFTVKHLPGHAPGHVAFYTKDGLIFGGDVLLEHISTNALINFNPDTGKRNHSLPQYRQSLKWIAEKNGIVLPGHGRMIKNIREVAKRHLKEQEDRYHKISALLSKKPYSLYELAWYTFSEAMDKGDAFLVLSEVMGYLDWGLKEGTFQQEKTSNGIIFRTV